VKSWLKGGIIGAIIGYSLSILNIILGRIPEQSLGFFSKLIVSPHFFGLIPCGRTCYGYWMPITTLEITIFCALIGLIIGKIKSRNKLA
jgi:hypothetical protein